MGDHPADLFAGDGSAFNERTAGIDHGVHRQLEGLGTAHFDKVHVLIHRFMGSRIGRTSGRHQKNISEVAVGTYQTVGIKIRGFGVAVIFQQNCSGGITKENAGRAVAPIGNA